MEEERVEEEAMTDTERAEEAEGETATPDQYEGRSGSETGRWLLGRSKLWEW